jgi:2-C-methyl-D-erythritol 4-phosphate cytidylyltransferase
MRTTVIIPAAGSGTRFGADVPKQFVALHGIPIIVRTLQVFEETERVESVIIAASQDFHEHLRALQSEYGLKKIAALVEGGKERQNSIMNALQTSICQASDVVLVHDAVRPLITPDFITSIAEAAWQHGAAIPGLVPKETIKECSEAGVVRTTHERSRLRAIQTPQGFRREIIVAAYNKAHNEGFLGTDDASVVEFAGFPVRILPGMEENMKITTPLDFEWCRWRMQEKRSV